MLPRNREPQRKNCSPREIAMQTEHAERHFLSGLNAGVSMPNI
jgi:hypothetical protein